MTKKLHKLEEETTMWKGKWESCEKTLQKVVVQLNKHTFYLSTIFKKHN
jgi:hypothetical protein